MSKRGINSPKRFRLGLMRFGEIDSQPDRRLIAATVCINGVLVIVITDRGWSPTIDYQLSLVNRHFLFSAVFVSLMGGYQMVSVWIAEALKRSKRETRERVCYKFVVLLMQKIRFSRLAFEFEMIWLWVKKPNDSTSSIV